jgi:integrase
LRPTTVELYRWLLSKHISPYLGQLQVGKITPDVVREWRAALLADGVSVSAAAKAYRLLRAVLMTAADDRIIPRNPCRIRGAGDEKPLERPVLTIAQVFELAGLMKNRRFRALILLATFASLRWGEVIALRRCDIDLGGGTVRVRRQYLELRSQLVMGPPKSRAGMRTVGLPPTIVTELRDHMAVYTGAAENALVFTGPLGGVLRRGNFPPRVCQRQSTGWACRAFTFMISGTLGTLSLRPARAWVISRRGWVMTVPARR